MLPGSACAAGCKKRQDAAPDRFYAEAMKSNIRWASAVAAVLLAEVVLVGCAFGWVAVYSHAIAPGQPVQAYQAYAQQASPWVSILVGMPLFYAIARWWLRSAGTALVAGLLYLLLDTALLLAAASGGGAALPWALVGLSYGSKLLAGALGLRAAAASPSSTRPA
jgi:hypothetical protein